MFLNKTLGFFNQLYFITYITVTDVIRQQKKPLPLPSKEHFRVSKGFLNGVSLFPY